MTVKDLLDNFEIQGALRVQQWDMETHDMRVFYESDENENAHVNNGYEWLSMEIRSIWATTTYNHNNIEIPQIVIEL